MDTLDSKQTPHVGVRIVTVGEAGHGQRVDNFLLRELKGVPKSKIYRILRKGEVRVNKGRVKPSHRLQHGDQVRLPPLRIADRDNDSATMIPHGVCERLARSVLYQDERLLVIDKPSGIAVHKGSGLSFGIIEALRTQPPYSDGAYLELAHRLDRDSSGCLLLAKTPAALREIQAAMQAATAQKRYLALVRGRWNLGRHELSVALRKNTLRGGERQVVVAADGKPALSRFMPVSLGSEASLLEVEIVTGRTHQIRVHAAHLGHPLAGDDKYGDTAFNRRLTAAGLRRLFLHAHSLSLPLSGRELAVSAPLPAELQGLLDALGIS